MSDSVTPLRWCHFRDGPEGAGVYVHVADLLALFDAVGAEQVEAELKELLTDRLETPPSR